MAVISTAIATSAFAAGELMDSFSPDLPELPEPPQASDPDIQRQREQEKRRLLARQGTGATNVTGGVEESANIQRKTLLGD